MFKYQISLKLLENIKNITRHIAELNQKRHSQIVLHELEKEANSLSAYSSTSIEGNPLPLTEVKKILRQKPLHLRNTEKEVLNYNEALIWLKNQISTDKFTFNSQLILQIHQRTVAGLLPKFSTGKFRKEPVFVNDPHKRTPIYWPPDHQDVAGLMQELIQFVSKSKAKIDPIILAGIFHKQFVIVHPFIDGNGRSVRLMTMALLADLGLDTFHLFSFENYYNRNVTRYFDFVGARGNYYDIYKKIDFTAWLEYFSEGILDELLRVKKILESQTPTVNPKDKISEEQQKILSFITENGHIRDKDYAKLTARAKATRALDFKKLIGLKLIEKLGRGPATYYVLKKKNDLA